MPIREMLSAVEQSMDGMADAKSFSMEPLVTAVADQCGAPPPRPPTPRPPCSAPPCSCTTPCRPGVSGEIVPSVGSLSKPK